ncbi:MAG: hypothetical protein JO138_04240 [Acidobacteriaceae bacterium]|nr:hypothetical protein [Acidobacteriaceae bacterium]
MKYWLYLAAKVVCGSAVVYGLQAVLVRFYPNPAPIVLGKTLYWGDGAVLVRFYADPALLLPNFGPVPPLFLHDMLFTFLTLGVWLIGAGLLFVTVRDQRRRCRTCLRKLIMPIQKGSWGNLITFGRPQTEWICPFGHGTLSIEELQITGMQLPGWQPHSDDIWKELESYEARK